MRARLEELAQRVLLLSHGGEEAVELLVDRLDHRIEALAIGGMRLLVLGTGTRKMRRNVRVLDLVLRARDDAHPWLAVGLGIALDGREEDDVVDADDVRLHLVENAGQILLRPFGGLDDHAPAVLHVIVDLLVGALAEVRNVPVDEVDPELRHLLRRQRLRKIHRMSLEAIALVNVEKAGVRKEHHLVAQFLQRLPDADGVERRAEGGFGEERNHLLRLPCRLPCGLARRLGLCLGGFLRLAACFPGGLGHRVSPSVRISGLLTPQACAPC